MNLIGISGKIKSGKDETGRIIQYIKSNPSVPYSRWEDELGGYSPVLTSGYEVKKFADKIKDTVCLWLGCTREQLEDHDYKNKELGEDWNLWYVDYNTKKLISKTDWASKSVVERVTSPAFTNEEDALAFREKLIPYENVPLECSGRCLKMTPRKLLQLVGTECGRQIIHPNIWINALFADYKALNFDNYQNCEFPNWTITDVRFPNEVQAIKNRGGIVIRVNRRIDLRFPKIWKEFIKINSSDSEEKHFISWLQNHSNEKYRELGISLIHESETSLDDYEEFDYDIDNNGTIDELVKKIKKIMKHN